MQTKHPGRLELKGIFFFVLFCLLFLQMASAAPPSPKQRSETPEERARIDKALASQERGRPIEGRVLKKPLGKISTRPSIKRVLGAEEAKSAVRKKVAEKGKAEEKAMEPRESRFKPEALKKPLR